MQARLPRFLSADAIARNRAKLVGFAAGAVGTLVLSLFMGVVYTGESAFAEREPSAPIYPNF